MVCASMQSRRCDVEDQCKCVLQSVDDAVEHLLGDMDEREAGRLCKRINIKFALDMQT